MNPRSDTKTIITAMKYLSEDGIYSEDGVANAAIAEAAQRLQELVLENEVILKNQLKAQEDLAWWKETASINAKISLNLYEEIEELKAANQELEDYTDKLVNHIPYLPKDMEILREANGQFAEMVQDLEDRLEDAKAEYIHLLQYVKILQQENEKLKA
jgi:FtsZ-binding cell division protein ZapB